MKPAIQNELRKQTPPGESKRRRSVKRKPRPQAQAKAAAAGKTAAKAAKPQTKE